MSGNPFRNSQAFKPVDAASASTSRFHNADTSSTEGTVRDHDSGPPPSSKTKKSVRIQSPATSAPHPAFHNADSSLPRSTTPGEYAEKPTAKPPAGISGSLEHRAFEDPSGIQRRGFDEDEGWDMTGKSDRDRNMQTKIQPLSGAPLNPFAKTLATIESQGREDAELAHAAGQQRDSDQPGSGTSKANLDVESFKKLLMTGIAGQSSNTLAPVPNLIAPANFESSSSTDTSSISHQSISEAALQEPHTETPRTSYEMAASDDETVALVANVKKAEKKSPPPAPAHRHGKLVSPRAPQTVSFTDFRAIQPTSSPVPQHRTNSDLNKPLPPTPPVISPPSHIISQDISQDLPEEAHPHLETRNRDSADVAPAPTSQKRVPPPVPLSRRQSQLRSATGNRSRSSSILTISSQHSITEFPILTPGSESTSSPSHKVPPLPPPSRRHGSSLTGGNPPSSSSSTAELPNTASTHRMNVSSPIPPSPRRPTLASPSPSPALGQAELARTSSVSSNRNAPRSVSNGSTSTPPPPPPPPRRRRSGRSSLDKDQSHHPPNSSPTQSRQTSWDYKSGSFDGNRRTSVASESSLKYEYAPAADNAPMLYSPNEQVEEPESLEPDTIQASTQTNILDDMEKFQREIDELRERYQKGG